MTRPPPPEVECDLCHAQFAAPDLRAAIAYYIDRLGFRLGFTWGEPPTFAGVNLGRTQLFLEQGDAEPKGCSAFFVVDDADSLYAFHQGAGVEILVPIDDREYGLRDYRVRDLNGYHLSFGHHLPAVSGPPLLVERVAVTVPLERRLAALLTDLAAHKRMSVTGVLEETLLHTLDGVGPHTPRDLRMIEQLKARHGIDYDTHASYRFVEREPDHAS